MNFLTSGMQRLHSWWNNTGKPAQRPDREAILTEKLASYLATGRLRFLPYIDSLTDETAEMRAAYRTMLREPSIKAPLLDKVLSVASLDLKVNPAEETEHGKRVAEFCRDLVLRSKGGLRGLAEKVLLPALLEGFSVCEPRLSLCERGRWRFHYLLEELASVDSRHYQFASDEFNHVVAVKSTTTNEVWAPQNFVIFKHLPVFGNPLGMSDLRAAYRAFWIKHTAWTLRAIALERFTLPIFKGTYKDDGDKAALETALKNVRSMGYIVAPEGAVVEALNIASRGEADFKSAIADLDQEMYTAIAGAFLQAMTGGVNEQRGSSETHRGTFELRVWHLAACLEDVLNDQLFPLFVDLNFAEVDDYPRAQLGGVNDGDLEPATRIDTALAALGLPLSRKELYEKYDRQPPLNDADALSPPRPTGAPAFADQANGQAVAVDPIEIGTPAEPNDIEEYAKALCDQWNQTPPDDAAVADAHEKLRLSDWAVHEDARGHWAVNPAAEFHAERFAEQRNGEATSAACTGIRAGAADHAIERLADTLAERLEMLPVAMESVPVQVTLPREPAAKPPKPKQHTVTIVGDDGRAETLTVVSSSE